MHWIANGFIGLTKVALGIDRADAQTVDFRYEVCRVCPRVKRSLNLLMRCGVCGCYIPAKIRLNTQSCSDKPPRWTARIIETEAPKAGVVR